MDVIVRLQRLLGPSAQGYIPLERNAPPPREVSNRASTKAVIRLHVLCLFFGLGTSVWG